MPKINIASGYANQIRALRYSNNHIKIFKGKYAEIELTLGEKGPGWTFYYLPDKDFYVYGLKHSTSTKTFFIKGAEDIGGTSLNCGCSHDNLGTADISISRSSVFTLFENHTENIATLKIILAIGVVLFAEALRSDPVLTSVNDALSSSREVELKTLSHFFDNWSKASKSKSGGHKWNEKNYTHHWLGLNLTNYPKKP